MGAVNLKQIAERAGVSLATASRVLSGSDYPVKEELRLRVLEVAEELDYVPNANARGLLRGRSQTVGVLVGDGSEPSCCAVISGIRSVASEADYMVSVSETHRDPERELRTLRRLRAQRVDVIIAVSATARDEDHNANIARNLASFMRSGKSVVLVGRQEIDDDLPACRIAFDNRRTAALVADHLHELGHRKVALITGDARQPAEGERVAAFHDCFGDELIIVESDLTRDDGHRIAGELLAQHPEITAIATTADQLSFGVLTRLREEGVAVPGHISVTGFNDIDFAQDTVPSLTSAHVPLHELGRTAMRVGLDAIDAEPLRVDVATSLIVRDSTGPARA